MRRVFGAVALVLGVTLLVLGAVSRPLIYDKVATVALDQRSTSVSEGRSMETLRVWSDDQGTSHFDQLTDATIRSTRQVVGIPGRAARGGARHDRRLADRRDLRGRRRRPADLQPGGS